MATEWTQIERHVGQDLQFVVSLSGVSEDITPWEVDFDIFKQAGAAPVLSKTEGAGIAVDNAAKTLTITLARADTLSLEPRQYQAQVARTDAGANTVLAYGPIRLLGRPA